MTPDLYARLWKKVNEPVPPGDAPDIDGDILLNCQDTPTRLIVGAATIDHDHATVKVRLYFDAEQREYRVSLRPVHGAWKIENVNFGQDGNLTDQL